MDEIGKILSVAIVAAVCCSVIKTQNIGLSAVLSMAACVLVLVMSFRFMRPVISTIERLRKLSSLSGAVVAPMLKVAGIGILTQICCAICEDVGEKALHNAVQIGAMILSLYAASPLLSAVLNLLEEVLH